VCISDRQRGIHVITEALSLALGAPYLAHVATLRRPLTDGERFAAGVFAAAIVLIDGGLLLKWSREARR
jgi:hypothetical protein